MGKCPEIRNAVIVESGPGIVLAYLDTYTKLLGQLGAIPQTYPAAQ